MKRKSKFKAGQTVEPVEAYAGTIDGIPYVGVPGKTRIDGGDPPAQAWPHLHKLLDPNAYKDDE
jgi:hypothetical protein